MKDQKEKSEERQSLFNEEFIHEKEGRIIDPQPRVQIHLEKALDRKNRTLSPSRYLKPLSIAAMLLVIVGIYSLIQTNSWKIGNNQYQTSGIEAGSIDNVLLEMDRVEYQSSRIMPDGALTKN